jgi:hypothetical protein
MQTVLKILLTLVILWWGGSTLKNSIGEFKQVAFMQADSTITHCSQSQNCVPGKLERLMRIRELMKQ